MIADNCERISQLYIVMSRTFRRLRGPLVCYHLTYVICLARRRVDASTVQVQLYSTGPDAPEPITVSDQVPARLLVL